jgi:hypothetical protein
MTEQNQGKSTYTLRSPVHGQGKANHLLRSPVHANGKGISPKTGYTILFMAAAGFITSITMLSFYVSSRLGACLPTDTSSSSIWNPVVTDKYNNRENDLPRILVTFSGPNSKTFLEAKVQLYERNLDFFLKHGMVNACQDRDTVITVGYDYYDEYYPKIAALDEECQQWAKKVGAATPHFVRLVARRNVCYDMESARMVLGGGVGGVPAITTYDYFIYINCGVTGPHPNFETTWVQYTLQPLLESQQRQHHLDLEAKRHDGRGDNTTNSSIPLVHMTGLSVNCEPGSGLLGHVQSMMYAVDKIGLEVIKDVPYDCLDPNIQDDVIHNYERKMSHEVLKRGHAIASFLGPFLQPQETLLQRSEGDGSGLVDAGIGQSTHSIASPYKGGPIITKYDSMNCQLEDPWITAYLHKQFHGKYPFFNQTIFWKTTRILPDDITELIGWVGDVPFKW